MFIFHPLPASCGQYIHTIHYSERRIHKGSKPEYTLRSPPSKEFLGEQFLRIVRDPRGRLRDAALNPENRRQHSLEILWTHFGTLNAKDYSWYMRYLNVYELKMILKHFEKYLSCMPLGARALPSWRSPRLMPIQTKIRKQIHRVSPVLGYWFFSGSCCQTVLPTQRSGWITRQHPRVWPGLLCNYLPICVLSDSTLICFTEGLNLPFPKCWHLIIWQNTAKDVLKTSSFCHPVMLPVRPQRFRRQMPTCKWQYVVHRRLHECLRGHDPRSTKSATSHHRINHHVGPGLPIPQEIWKTVQRIETTTVNILQAQMDEVAIGNANI